jgi:class 3 adenylate cyclase
MDPVYRRNFDEPDEVVQLEKTRSELLTIGGLTMAHDTHEPGWHWAEHVRPHVGTDSCQAHHMSFIIRGRLKVRLDDGTEFECRKGDVLNVPPGHDSWVIGDEPFETLAFMGGATWLAPLQSLRERVLVTLLFTDIVDSTGVARRLGDHGWAELLGTHNQRITESVRRHGGEIAKLTGDGILAIFDGAARAIRCALACQKDAADLGLAIRAAVHSGEVEVAGDEIHGLAVHEAARILTHAQGGQVMVSDLTKTFARGTHLEFKEVGEVELRGLEDPIHLHLVTGGR